MTNEESYCNIITVKPYLNIIRLELMNLAIEKVTLPVARKIAGLTQKSLAFSLGVSESTVINWEKGRSEPTVTQAQEISKVIGIPLDSIIFLPSNTVKP